MNIFLLKLNELQIIYALSFKHNLSHRKSEDKLIRWQIMTKTFVGLKIFRGQMTYLKKKSHKIMILNFRGGKIDKYV